MEPASDKAKPADNSALYDRLKGQIMEDIDKLGPWRTRAKANFQFVTGGERQWSAEDVQLLKDQKRPLVTFNRTLKFLKAVCGIEANNRHETTFLPTNYTQPQEVKVNETLSATSDWMGRECDADRHQSRAFRDAAITGVGVTESVLDFDDDPRGKYKEERFSPLEFGWDHTARDMCLLDSKRRWRIRQMPLKEARALIPGVTDAEGVTGADLNAEWAAGFDKATDRPRTQQQKEQRNENLEIQEEDPVHLVKVQWWEYETYYKVVDPRRMQSADQLNTPVDQANSSLLVDMSKSEFAQLEKQVKQADPRYKIPHMALRRKVYKQAILGGKILGDVMPCPRGNGFTMNAITYEPDDVDGSWYGLVDLVRDPATWSNKFFSQAMHIINSTAKGGVIAEEDAFVDMAEAQKTYASPQAITVASKGAISKGKIVPKPGQGIPNAIINMFQVATNTIQDVLGMNLELMGMADRQQAGVLEAQRKQAAMTILATLFDGLQMFRREVGRTRLWYIQNHFAKEPNPRMMRITDDEGYKLVALNAQAAAGEYDVIVDDAPTSPNNKEKVWAALQPVLPAFKGMITPPVAVMLLEYVPGIPSKLIDAFKTMASQPDPDAAQKREMAITDFVNNQKKLMSETGKNNAAAASARAGAVLDLANAAKAEAEANATRWTTIQAALAPQIIEGEAEDVGPKWNGPTLPELGQMPPMQQQEAPAVDPAALASIAGVELPAGIVPPGGLGGPQ